jgi:MoxR-like ATPase
VSATMPMDQVTARAGAILDEVERAVVGKRDVVEIILIALLADGHVLLEDLPGLGKTLIARAFAQATGLGFTRVQFTPDLMPADITGSSVFDARNASVEFRPGPVFTNVLLADEINRASPKTQAALLEAMQERQVSADGTTHQLPSPFLTIATQNPIEFEGTYPLPEAQLDRFLVRVAVGYPDGDAELEVLTRRLRRQAAEPEVRAVVGAAEFRSMQRALEQVHVDGSIGRYIVDLVAATRGRPTVEVGASPRGSLGLLVAARAAAVLRGRDFVVPEDVKELAVAVLAHRLRLRADLWVRGARGEEVVRDCLREVPTPVAEPAEGA